MPKIATSKGNIYFKTRPLYLGVKRIDKDIAEENLLLFKNIIDSEGIKFGLIAGTLLGAVREKDFITHDEDIDLFLLEEDKQRLFDSLPKLLENGFEIARYDRRGLMSIIRKDEYIDLYFFSKYKDGLCFCSGWTIPEKFLLNTTTYSFKGSDFCVPEEYVEFLKYEYGKDWLTPISYTDFNVPGWKIKLFELKEKAKDLLPDWLFFRLAKKSEQYQLNIYSRKLERYKALCKESKVSKM